MESKEAKSDLHNIGDEEETANPHGDMGCGSVTQVVTEPQHDDSDMTQNWCAEILNHALVHILNKDKMGTGATNDFVVFIMGQGIDNVHIMTMSEDNFKSMGCNIDFKMFWSPQALNKMHNKQVLDAMLESDENMWFLDLSKCMLMHHMMCECKVTATPVTAGNVMIGFKKDKVGSSFAIKFSNVQHWKTSAGCCANSWKCTAPGDIWWCNNSCVSVHHSDISCSHNSNDNTGSDRGSGSSDGTCNNPCSISCFRV